jgi:hypothetical protein
MYFHTYPLLQANLLHDGRRSKIDIQSFLQNAGTVTKDKNSKFPFSIVKNSGSRGFFIYTEKRKFHAKKFE